MRRHARTRKMRAEVAASYGKVPPSADLGRVFSEARAIADGIGDELTSVHVLLAMFTTPNPGEVALKEHALDEGRLLALVKPSLRDGPQALSEALTFADETALRCDARQTNTLHLLVAFLKVRECAAYHVLDEALGGVGPFRNRLMSWLTGVLPRRLQLSIQDARVDEPAPLPPRRRLLGQRPGDDWVVPKKTMLDDSRHDGGRRPVPLRPTMADAPRSRKSVVDSVVDSVVGSVIEEVAADAADEPLEPRPKADRTPKAPLTRPAPSEVAGEEPRPATRRAPEAKNATPARRSEPAAPSVAMSQPPTQFDLDPDRFPWLTSLGRNLTALAALGGLDPSVGRAKELEQLIDVLGKRRANNPCLVGEPGVGKTAIVEGLAVKLVRGDADAAPLEGKILIELDMGRIVAGTALRGSFSERMQGLKRDVQRSKGQVIVFIDEIHTLMGAGGSGDGPQDAANELKAALARGDFPCIGSTTIDEFKKHIEQDPALERRFVKLLVEEPSDEEAIQILRGAAPLYESHHKLKATDDALCAAVQLSSRFIHDKRLPAKALDLLDLALSRGRRAGLGEIGRAEVARVCSDVAKVPLERVQTEDAKRFLQMEAELKRRVIGHENVVGRVAHCLRRNYAGFATHRPMGTFLFLGPSGVGKTELAKALADFLFGSEKALIRLDMSEYSEPHTVARLVGAPPGYVGHQEGGQLTEAIRARPHAVVLLDEIEKAHADILPLLLQVLDEGRLTDSRGRTVTFRHAVLVLTSNLGAQAAQKQKTMGFAVDDAARERRRAEEGVLDAARKHFAPELWGRIEEKLVFSALTRPELMHVAGLQLEQSSKALVTTRNIMISFDEAVLAFLVDQAGTDASVGARPLRQVIQRLVETPVSEAILRGEVKDGARIRLAVQDGRLIARAARRA